MKTETYQQRAVEEKNELDLKIDSLKDFIFDDDNPTFGKLNKSEQLLLQSQLKVMKEYSQILKERIALFPSHT